MTITEETKLHRGTNWWGAFVIGLSGPILVTGIDPPAVGALGAAAIRYESGPVSDESAR